MTAIGQKPTVGVAVEFSSKRPLTRRPEPRDPTTPPQTVAVGAATVTFTSCTSALFQYSFTAGSNAGKSGTIPLQRVGPVPPGCGP